MIAQFDNELWADIRSVVKDLYPVDNAKYPKCLHPLIKELKRALNIYSSEKVTNYVRFLQQRLYNVYTNLHRTNQDISSMMVALD